MCKGVNSIIKNDRYFIKNISIFKYKTHIGKMSKPLEPIHLEYTKSHLVFKDKMRLLQNFFGVECCSKAIVINPPLISKAPYRKSGELLFSIYLCFCFCCGNLISEKDHKEFENNIEELYEDLPDNVEQRLISIMLNAFNKYILSKHFPVTINVVLLEEKNIVANGAFMKKTFPNLLEEPFINKADIFTIVVKDGIAYPVFFLPEFRKEIIQKILK
jgi:hypothetical protein